MKFERIGWIYGAVVILGVVILIPLILSVIAPFTTFVGDSIASIMDYLILNQATTETQKFSRALVYSFTLSFILFMGIGTLMQNRKNSKSIERYDNDDLNI